MIEIWGRVGCSFCNKAKYLCQAHRYQYIYKTLGEDFTREELLEQFPTARTFPQIRYVDHQGAEMTESKYIGGYDEFKKWHDERDNTKQSKRPQNLWPSDESYGG